MGKSLMIIERPLDTCAWRQQTIHVITNLLMSCWLCSAVMLKFKLKKINNVGVDMIQKILNMKFWKSNPSYRISGAKKLLETKKKKTGLGLDCTWKDFFNSHLIHDNFLPAVVDIRQYSQWKRKLFTHVFNFVWTCIIPTCPHSVWSTISSVLIITYMCIRYRSKPSSKSISFFPLWTPSPFEPPLPFPSPCKIHCWTVFKYMLNIDQNIKSSTYIYFYVNLCLTCHKAPTEYTS